MPRKKTKDSAEEKPKTPQANTLTNLINHQNTQLGEGTLFRGSKLPKDPPRLPSGVFSVDFASGGGLPLWGTTCFWGKEGGGKTNLALNVVRMCQSMCWSCFQLADFCTCSKSPLRMKAYWGDAEGTLDSDWSTLIGVNMDDLVIGWADYGEQHVNIADSALKTDDCGLIVIDSLASLIPASEFEAAMEDQFVAAQARLITRMVRKMKQRLIRERKRGHPCTVLFTNQLRIKIGQIRGNPETMPGGQGLKHEFSLLLRCIQKSMSKDKDGKYLDSVRAKPLASRFSFSIRKEKVLTLAGVGEYVRAVENIPDLGLRSGVIDDYSTIMTYARSYEVVSKQSGGKWGYLDKSSSKLENIKEFWRRDWAERQRASMEIVSRAKRRLLGAEPKMHDVQGDKDNPE